MQLIVKGNVPSQKNRKIISMNRATGRPFLRSADSVKTWQAEALVQLKQQFKGYVITDYPIGVTCTVYYGNRRRHDLDNALGTVMDALTAAKIIVDDDTSHVECLVVQFGGYDKENPRVEIDLEE